MLHFVSVIPPMMLGSWSSRVAFTCASGYVCPGLAVTVGELLAADPLAVPLGPAEIVGACELDWEDVGVEAGPPHPATSIVVIPTPSRTVVKGTRRIIEYPKEERCGLSSRAWRPARPYVKQDPQNQGGRQYQTVPVADCLPHRPSLSSEALWNATGLLASHLTASVSS